MRATAVAAGTRWAVSLTLVAAAFVLLDTSSVVRHVTEADWRFAAPALAGLVMVHLVASTAWRGLAMRMTEIRLDWREAARLHYAGQAAGAVTPGNVGADAYRAVALLGHGAGLRAAVVPILVQRATSYASLVGLAAAAALALPGEAVPFPLPPASVIASSIGVALVLVSVAALWVYRRPGATDRGVSKVARLNARHLGYGIVFGILFHGLSVVLAYLLLLALEPSAPLSAIPALALVRLAILLPLSVNGIGFQEGAAALILPTVGVDAAVALAATLLSRLALLLTVLIGVASISGRRYLAGGQRESSA